jgi:hypothetical protein
VPNFELIPKDWYKRRAPTFNNNLITRVEVPDFKKEKYHMCTLIAHYADNTTKEFIARVLQNHVHKGWTVDAAEVAVRVVD